MRGHRRGALANIADLHRHREDREQAATDDLPAPSELHIIAASVDWPGVYAPNVDVANISGPTGMFLSAVLEGRCTKAPVKPEKGEQAN